ncbi:S41 family peptidase [Maribacter sp. 2308TA10-17]|uniref:S41 family peptidase n=1 Tax=Maribacter sp. 2308TA10-17 TaxID=3386276 RepID=UPI0039BCC66C
MKQRILILVACTILSAGNAQNEAKKHKKLFNTLIETTHKNICNPAFLETKDWEEFESQIKALAEQKLSDRDFAKAFNNASDKLPFSHYYLKHTGSSKKENRNTKTNEIPPFELVPIDNTTAVLFIRSFDSNTELMINIVQQIAQNGYKNLIIDLRNNQGGSLDAAVVLGRFLTAEIIDAGAYIGRSWFEEKQRYPSLDEINSFPYLKEMTYQGFQEASQNPAFRMVLPPHNNSTYSGKVYVLTSKKTASACEPLVYLLKNQKVVTIVGEPTAGEMMSGMDFKLDDQLTIFLPVLDYITAAGTRLDRVGVQPTIEVLADKALTTVLQSIE